MFNIDTLRLEDPIRPLGPPIRKPADVKPPEPEKWVPVLGNPDYVRSTIDGSIKDAKPLPFPIAIQEAMASNGEDPSMIAFVDDDLACCQSIRRAIDRGVSSSQRFAAVVRFSDDESIIRASNVAAFVAAVDALEAS